MGFSIRTETGALHSVSPKVNKPKASDLASPNTPFLFLEKQ